MKIKLTSSALNKLLAEAKFVNEREPKIRIMDWYADHLWIYPDGVYLEYPSPIGYRRQR